MLLLGLLLVAVASVPPAGGRLGRLAEIRFRRGWAAVAAVALQTAILRVFPDGPWRRTCMCRASSCSARAAR
jgi:hypothetical protein